MSFKVFIFPCYSVLFRVIPWVPWLLIKSRTPLDYSGCGGEQFDS